MAFCKYCGTKLEEGQVCNCQQAVANRTPEEPVMQAAPAKEEPQTAQAQAAPQAAAPAVDYGKLAGDTFNNTIGAVLGILKKPFEGGANFVKAGNDLVAIILIVLQSLLFGTWAAIYAGKLEKQLGGFVDIPGGKWFFVCFLASAAMVVLWAGLFFAMYKIMKSNATFKQTLRLATIKTVPGILMVVLSILFALLDSGIAFALIILIPVVGAMFMIQAMAGIEDVCPNKRTYIMLVVFVVAITIFVVVGYKSAEDAAQTLLGGMLGGLFY